jgi:hypothetical protein
MLIDLDDNYNFWANICTPEIWAELRLGFPTLPVEKPSWTSEAVKNLVLTDDNKFLLVKYNLNFKIAKGDLAGTAGQMLIKLQDQIESLGLEVKNKLSKLEAEALGCAVQIHVPDLSLMFIREVTHLDDACTDVLQGYLNEGWCILAVCPPNAQRRPDYILGRRSNATSNA